jgi:hypothetical protein
LAPIVYVLGKIGVPVRVGELAKTSAPVPVSSVTAVMRLAEDGVAKKVATPVPKPEIPVATGRPVALVKVAADGVPRLGVTRTGEVAKTAAPVPVSSLRIAASWAEVVKAEDNPREEVATCDQVFPAPPIRSWFCVMEERPVPPRVAARVPVVSEIAIPRVEVATVEIVLSALTRIKVTALGLAAVKRLAPRVVAPRLVRALAAVVAPVPPEVIARAWPRVKLVIVVVARVEVPVTPIVPEKVAAAPAKVPVKVGEALKTATPVPVSSDNEDRS